jgi:hypothetical protein
MKPPRIALLSAAALVTAVGLGGPVPTARAATWHDGWCERGAGLSVVVDFGTASAPGLPVEGWLVRCLVGGVIDADGTSSRVYALQAVGLSVSHSNGFVSGIEGVEQPADNSHYWIFSGADGDGVWDPSRFDLPNGSHVDGAYGARWTGPDGASTPRPQPQFAPSTDPEPDPAVSGSTPVVSGRAQVGQALRVRPGAWSPGATLTRQWFRANKPIAGATGATYTVRPADVNKRLSVRVTGRLSGHTARTLSSARTGKVAKGRLTAPRPKLKGTLKVGRTLTAARGAWKPGGVTFAHRWFRNGNRIAGAGQRTYQLTARDRGRRITVRVIGTKPGHVRLAKVSPGRGPVR